MFPGLFCVTSHFNDTPRLLNGGTDVPCSGTASGTPAGFSSVFTWLTSGKICFGSAVHSLRRGGRMVDSACMFNPMTMMGEI
tara:strand:+ start:34096 stop:34341 length:246 start_codon:yes stop_codon:yes gene_type:complete